MAGPLPASTSSDLRDRINLLGDYLRSGGELNEMTWQRIRRDLEALAKNPEHRYTSLLLQAVLWEMKPDLEQARSLLNQALGRYGSSLEWYLTRANMAPSFGDCSLITDMLEKGYPIGSRAGLEKVVTMCSHAGMFTSAAKALDDLNRLEPSEDRKTEAAYWFVRPAANYLAANEIPELRVASRIVTACRVMIEHGFRLTSYTVRTEEDGVRFELSVDAEVDRLVEVSLAIWDALAVEFEDTLSDHLSIGVIPKEEVTVYGS